IMSTTKENKSLIKGRLAYFELVNYNKWSFDHFESWVEDNFGRMEDNATIFFKILHIIKYDQSTSRKVKKSINALMSKKDKPKDGFITLVEHNAPFQGIDKDSQDESGDDDQSKLNENNQGNFDGTINSNEYIVPSMDSTNASLNNKNENRDMGVIDEGSQDEPGDDNSSMKKTKQQDSNEYIVPSMYPENALLSNKNKKNMGDKSKSKKLDQRNNDSYQSESDDDKSDREALPIPYSRKRPNSEIKQLKKVIQNNSEMVIQKLNDFEKILKDQKPEAIDPSFKHEVKCPAFQWDARPECGQKDRLIGTTDATIVDRVSIATRVPQNHIWILFELKKSVNDGCIY
ncbi:6270_t:CDS:2, partial [Gigaspora margarita]